MIDTTYFVDYKLYNGTNQGWAMKTELKTKDVNEAIRKFGALVNDYYAKEPYTFGLITMSDTNGNVNDSKRWDNTSEPNTEE